jgi:transposase-like protein
MTIQGNTQMETIKCRYCESSNIIKWTKRKTLNRGYIQRYFCKDCKKYFVVDDGFFRMRNSPQKITQSVDLFYRGISTRGVQGHLAMFYSHNASNVSVYNWVLKYAKLIHKFTSRLKVMVGSEIEVDEIEYHRRKSSKAKLGTEKNFFIDGICPQTKFLISSEYSKSRGIDEIKAVIQRIKENTGNQIKVITTDGWNAYENIIKKVYGYNNKLLKFNVIHNKNIISEQDGNFNHQIERLHNSVRARTKVMRGFHGSVASANAIMKGYEVYYNFINKQQTIKCCPYELAIPNLKLNSNNKWLELIQYANQNKII